MTQMIDGKHVASVLRKQIKEETAQWLNQTGKTPKLSVLIVGENPASQSYVRNKEKSAREVGFTSETIKLPETTTASELLMQIERLNQDDDVHGILVQLPLPKQMDEQAVIGQIAVHKDVDGFHPEQVGALSIGLESLEPCTPAGIVQLLKYYEIEVEGKHAVVVGRSNIVGKPVANMLLKLNATVTVVHSRTKDLASFTKRADILIVAIGKPYFLTADMVKKGAVVIDVGINRTAEGKLVGDVAFETVQKKVSGITPVPGGVGPMTITMLLANTLAAFKKSLTTK